MTGQVQYKAPVTINTGKAIVTVYVPDLDEDGERKRQERIKEAAANLLYEAERSRKTKLHN